jgi:predicted small secreted protein
MRKRWIGLLVLIALTLTACPSTPTDAGATWDTSNWDSTALWR